MTAVSVPSSVESTRAHRRAHTRKILRRVLIVVAQIGVSILVLLPFFWMLSVSFKPNNEPFSIPARLWPANPTLENYLNVLYPEFIRYGINSVIVSLLTMAVAISCGLLAAYSFSRIPVPGFRWILVAIVAAQMFPVTTMIIPIYQVVRGLGLINTYAALVLAYITLTLPVSIWMLRSFISNIPAELEEAAMVDGCTRFQAFVRIIVPLALPGIVATAVWIAIVTWQEFIFALTFTTSQDMRTIPVGILDFVGQYGIKYGEMMAGSIVVSIPIIILFFWLQKYFIAGLTAGAVKG
jgi:multiple sugar transport system permease protein/raffinose/stachyose/melibiose transport system permease protein